MNGCDHFKELTDYQVWILKEHLAKHKYYLEEKGIHLTDIDLEHDFIIKHYSDIVHDMRLLYCGTICVLKDTCEIAKEFKKLG